MSRQDSLEKLFGKMTLKKVSPPKQSPPKQSRKRAASPSPPKDSLEAMMAKFSSMGLAGRAKKSRTTKMTASNVKAVANASKFVGSTAYGKTRAQTRGGPSAMEDIVRTKKSRAPRASKMSINGGTGSSVKSQLQAHIKDMMSGGKNCHNCNEEQNGGTTDILASYKKMPQTGGRR